MKPSVIHGDITTLRVDAVVNAANEALMGGGGVDGAIHHAAGPALIEACRKIGRCATGSAVATPAFQLRARIVIHAVGPRWRDGRFGEDLLLANAYRHCLDLAQAYNCRSIAFPCISTGVYGYPPALACDVAVTAVEAWLARNPPIEAIFCCFSDGDARLYIDRLRRKAA